MAHKCWPLYYLLIIVCTSVDVSSPLNFRPIRPHSPLIFSTHACDCYCVSVPIVLSSSRVQGALMCPQWWDIPNLTTACVLEWGSSIGVSRPSLFAKQISRFGLTWGPECTKLVRIIEASQAGGKLCYIKLYTFLLLPFQHRNSNNHVSVSILCSRLLVLGAAQTRLTGTVEGDGNQSIRQIKMLTASGECVVVGRAVIYCQRGP